MKEFICIFKKRRAKKKGKMNIQLENLIARILSSQSVSSPCPRLLLPHSDCLADAGGGRRTLDWLGRQDGKAAVLGGRFCKWLTLQKP